MLEIQNLCISYGGRETVKDVSFAVQPGQIVGIVGESGSGKSTILRSLLNLLPGNGKITSGKLFFHGQELTGISEKDWRRIRGKEISMIFQHPMESLDPTERIGSQFCESMKAVQGIGKKEAFSKAEELLSDLGLDDPKRVLNSFPFELSGGMCQRAAIAMAAANGAELILADEPTSALDVTVQAQTIEVLKKLRDRNGTSILLVTHNMGVVANMADFLGVMYQGELVEWGTVQKVLHDPEHEYTKKLIRAIPKLRY